MTDHDILDHWGKRSLDAILPHFEKAEISVKISSGFFTVSAFNLIQPALEGTTTLILVGYDDTQNANLIGKLLADVRADLMRWGPDNRREAVSRLVAKLQRQEVYFRENDDEPYADARIRKNDHGKVYIVDDRLVWLGSLNLTNKGLIYNHESNGALTQPERVQKWVQFFEEKWNAPDTRDLTQLLLQQLLDWLDLVDPFHVYLKSIQALVSREEPDPPRKRYKLPAAYQQVIIKRVVRQLKTYRGAMIVASTGMGKTVMATDVCFRLHRERLIDTVLVFAPKPTHLNWSNDLDDAGINHKTFSQQVLSQNSTGPEGTRLTRYLDRLDERFVIIIDESHYFRNENTSGGEQKLSFSRLIDHVNSSGCYVLLLTATPYAKGYEDINHQLKLLPHLAPRQTRLASGQHVLPGMGIIRHPNAWAIPEEDFFEAFRRLEVVTLISTSWVARNFGTQTPEGDYVERPDGVVWIPHINLRKVNVPLPLERRMKNLIGGGYLKHEYKSVPTREGGFITTNSSVEDRASEAWSSSPLALEETLYQVMEDLYDETFVRSQEVRSEQIKPIYDELQQMGYADDPKFQALLRVIADHSGEKIIVFTQRKSTATYLEQAIAEKLPERSVATPIRRVKPLEYKSIEDDDLQRMIQAFAPISNRVEPPSDGIDILILTNAQSTGINLQDANVVVNYDLAWTPDVIIQRAGRIMRFWKEPRQVYIYAFVGVFEYDDPILDYDASGVSRQLVSLTARSKEAQEIAEIPIFPDGERQHVTSLGDFNKVTLEDLGELEAREIEDYSGGSPFLEHITALIQNQELADSLRDDINSAKRYDGEHEIVYLLLRHEGEYQWLVFNVSLEQFEDWSNDTLLAAIACDETEQVAAIDKGKLEVVAQFMRNDWCRRNDVQSGDVERICVMYLKPRHLGDDLEGMITID